jgi:hypothetical protein
MLKNIDRLLRDNEDALREMNNLYDQIENLRQKTRHNEMRVRQMKKLLKECELDD